MRHDLELRQSESFQPARVGRVDGLAGQFGMGEDALRAIHGARAAAHHQAVEAAQQLLQADLMQETVLRGDVAAAEHDPVRVADQIRRRGGIAPVQHRHALGPDAGPPDAVRHRRQDVVRESAVVRRGADQQHARGCREGCLHGGKQPVVFGKPVLPESGRTPCEDQRHRGRKDTKKRRDFCFCVYFFQIWPTRRLRAGKGLLRAGDISYLGQIKKL